MMSPNPFFTAFVTKLVSTSACHMIACLSLLHDNPTFFTFTVIVFHVQNDCFVFCAFTIVFKVHAFSTKLFLTLDAFKRVVFNHWNDALTVLRRTHPQKWVI